MVRDALRKKETREALDAAFAVACDVTVRELLVDVVQRLLTSDEAVLKEARKWLRERE